MNAIGKMWFACRDATVRLNDWYRHRAERKSITEMMHDSLLRRLTRRRPPMGLPVILLIALAVTVWSASVATAGCFRYGDTVTLSGQYFAAVAPPDDGIARDPRNDAARRATLLVMATPFCVDADIVSLSVPPALSIQLNCPALHPADGSELSLKGRLIGAHTSNGQTPVLLMCL